MTQGSWDLLRVTAACTMPSCSEVLSGEGSPEDQQARARDFCSKACRQLYHFHPYFRTNLCLHCFREPHYVFKKEWEPWPALSPKVPLESSLHFLWSLSPWKLLAALTWDCYHFPMVSLCPLCPRPPQPDAPHSSQHGTWWLWSWPDDSYWKRTCPCSASPLRPRADTRIYHRPSSVTSHVSFSSLYLGSNYIRFPPMLRPAFWMSFAWEAFPDFSGLGHLLLLSYA